MLQEYSDERFNTDDFARLNSFAKRIAYCRERLGQHIDNGSSRTVYAIDDNKVLKIAKNKKGVAQNEVEYDSCNDFIGYLFPQVYEYDKNNLQWIVCERARTPKVADIKRICGVTYKQFCLYCLAFEQQYKPSRYFSVPKLTEQDYEIIANNETLNSFYDYISNYQPYNVRELIALRNLGIVNRADGEELVIVDNGFNEDVAELYKKRLAENKEKKNMKKHNKRKKYFNYEPYIKSLLKFFNTKYKIKPYPTIKLSNLNQGDNNLFVKTGYYDPSQNMIKLFIHNRHIKDVLRSLSHELVHHYQNLENRLGADDYTGQEIIHDDKLMKLEEEAYLKGNIVFRSWTESLEENFDDKPTEHMRKLIKIDETTIKNIIKNKRELKK